jgi:uncharacterized membrane protein YphA (DoxX/SURF4 family)
MRPLGVTTARVKSSDWKKSLHEDKNI